MRNLKSEMIAAVLILLFAYTAFQKFAHHESFIQTLQHSGILSPFAVFASWLVPVTELAIVCLLFFPTLRKTGLVCSAVLLSGFTLYIVYLLLFVPNRPCSCGGAISRLSWQQHIAFNITFLLLSLYGSFTMKTDKHIAIRRSRTPVI